VFRYVGFSWASGIVTVGDRRPYPNGRNQESVSEAIAAYEAVALYGDVLSDIITNDENGMHRDNALRVRDIGRLLMATEVRSAKTYWHVQSPNTPGVSRIYPGESIRFFIRNLCIFVFMYIFIQSFVLFD
jgi:endoglucanase Acf2